MTIGPRQPDGPAGPRDHGTTEPQAHRTKRPTDHGTTGPQDHKTRRSSQATVCSHVRVRYAETDRMGVVYYANYLVWFEIGRTDWLRGAGFTYRGLEESGIVLPVIDVHCEYRQSARYDDDLEIRTQGTLLSRVRVRFDYEVHRPSIGAGGATRTAEARSSVLLARGHTIHACVDPTGRPVRLPDGVRGLFA
jgi:acyl-CoA thioester hydrolase